jgi:D-alanyl-D-alanine carboxypeptidase/Bacterial Ig domain
VNPNRLTAAALALACTLLTCVVLGQTGAATADGEGVSANQPPVAAPDRGTVVAGKAVTIDALANDTDDTQPPQLTIASFDPADGRVALNPESTAFVFTSRAADANRSFTFSYTASDGELTSNSATVTVTVTAPPPPPPPPPTTRKVTISMPRTVVALRRYTIHGSVHRVVPRPVDVVVQRLSGQRWVRYRSDRVDLRGAWSVPFSTNRPRRYVFRAVATWHDKRHATSARLGRTVVARPDMAVSGPLRSRDVPYSYRSGCPVAPSGLRRITTNRFTYSHLVARGSVVVRAGAVSDIVTVFRAAFGARFPVRSMRPADAFYAGGRRTPTQSDVAAMRADNTSAFNCRPVTGNPYRVSQHSYGNAIDINTVRNPYVVGSRVYPGFAGTYLNRSHVRPGMLTRRGVVATKMRQLGWPWGARWSHPDYQHFSSNGG